ncbi:hypothetical protein PNOK_0636600 [Pyrrhoderma noxium]|uniref:Uncharacterized protein n=1 Tax=Pyrrhoderma noxium TaxID=2282107 RepID=A0A286UE63_9AGAM|nr:hypothetical protein PNOK_0636600 [Pyrrhoderma noxium]
MVLQVLPYRLVSGVCRGSRTNNSSVFSGCIQLKETLFVIWTLKGYGLVCQDPPQLELESSIDYAFWPAYFTEETWSPSGEPPL